MTSDPPDDRLFLPFVRGFYRRFSSVLSPTYDLEDVEQLARIEAWRVSPTYTPDRGPFGPYLRACIRNCLHSLLDRERARAPTVPLDEVGERGAADPSPDDRIFLTTVRTSLTPDENVILSVLLGETTLKEAAARLGICTKTVSRRKRRLLHYLRSVYAQPP